jgi:hypothetical protein
MFISASCLTRDDKEKPGIKRQSDAGQNPK